MAAVMHRLLTIIVLGVLSGLLSYSVTADLKGPPPLKWAYSSMAETWCSHQGGDAFSQLELHWRLCKIPGEWVITNLEGRQPAGGQAVTSHIRGWPKVMLEDAWCLERGGTIQRLPYLHSGRVCIMRSATIAMYPI
jgi:hypothetical protein